MAVVLVVEDDATFRVTGTFWTRRIAWRISTSSSTGSLKVDEALAIPSHIYATIPDPDS